MDKKLYKYRYVIGFMLIWIPITASLIYFCYDGGILSAQRTTSIHLKTQSSGYKELVGVCHDDKIKISVRSELTLASKKFSEMLLSSVEVECDNTVYSKRVRYTPPLPTQDLNLNAYLSDVIITNALSASPTAHLRTTEEVENPEEFLGYVLNELVFDFINTDDGNN